MKWDICFGEGVIRNKIGLKTDCFKCRGTGNIPDGTPLHLSPDGRIIKSKVPKREGD